ncbi:MAG: tRNA (guanosine(46)-N7)-methyltransferase TrmB [Bdellovibrionota bacterium]
MFYLTDTGYRYPISRNTYFPKLLELARQPIGFNKASQVYLDNGAELMRGHWREIFSDQHTPGPSAHDRELHVEIGCNAGHVIVELAKRNPDKLYIGIECKHKAVYRCAQKAAKSGLRNIAFIRGNAFRIKHIFAEAEVDSLSIFFPDPWPRRSQRMNRLISARWLDQVGELLKPSGMLHIKTDHADYFDWIEKEFKKSYLENRAWVNAERSTDLYANHPSPQSLDIPDVTLFEKLFIAEGKPIFNLNVILKSAGTDFTAMP